jgi:hypothetical protein
MQISLCEHCRKRREVISGRGSRFLLCDYHRIDSNYPKYPGQPVLFCKAFEDRKPEPTRNPGV